MYQKKTSYSGGVEDRQGAPASLERKKVAKGCKQMLLEMSLEKGQFKDNSF